MKENEQSNEQLASIAAEAVAFLDDAKFYEFNDCGTSREFREAPESDKQGEALAEWVEELTNSVYGFLLQNIGGKDMKERAKKILARVGFNA